MGTKVFGVDFLLSALFPCPLDIYNYIGNSAQSQVVMGLFNTILTKRAGRVLNIKLKQRYRYFASIISIE